MQCDILETNYYAYIFFPLAVFHAISSSMLTISNLSYKIGARTLFENGNINIVDGWKVGVIGANGAGKSTLFKLISGELQPDGGMVTMTGNQRLAQVRQDIPETDTPLIDMVLNAHTEMAQLWIDAETETDPEKLGDIYTRLADLDAYAAPSRAATAPRRSWGRRRAGGPRARSPSPGARA